MKKTNQILTVFAGNLLMACAVNCFILPSGLITGGSAGLAIVFEEYLPVSFETASWLISMVCFLMGWVFMKSAFAARTMISAICYPVMINLTAGFHELIPSMPLAVQAVLGGAVMGAGLGLILKSGSSSGGLDIPPIILESRFHCPVSLTMGLMDCVLLALQISRTDLSGTICGFVLILTTYTFLNSVKGG